MTREHPVSLHISCPPLSCAINCCSTLCFIIKNLICVLLQMWHPSSCHGRDRLWQNYFDQAASFTLDVSFALHSINKQLRSDQSNELSLNTCNFRDRSRHHFPAVHILICALLHRQKCHLELVVVHKLLPDSRSGSIKIYQPGPKIASAGMGGWLPF